MQVKIGPYRRWFGPYQLAEALCFWVKPVLNEYGSPEKPEWVHDFGEWLAHGSIDRDKVSCDRPETWIYKVLKWVDGRKKRRISIRIDAWDTWNMDDTLAHIILPMLKQLKATEHGSPMVDDDDVPPHLRSTAVSVTPDDEMMTDSNIHERWEWVMDEMIFAFSSKLTDWEDQFVTTGPNHTVTIDDEGQRAYQRRISNGFRLFGKYYEALWD